MTNNQGKWDDIKDDIRGFGERITAKDPDVTADEDEMITEDPALASDAVDGPMTEEEFANDADIDADPNRPQFGERISDEDETAMNDDALAAPEQDEDYDPKAM